MDDAAHVGIERRIGPGVDGDQTPADVVRRIVDVAAVGGGERRAPLASELGRETGDASCNGDRGPAHHRHGVTVPVGRDAGHR